MRSNTATDVRWKFLSSETVQYLSDLALWGKSGGALAEIAVFFLAAQHPPAASPRARRLRLQRGEGAEPDAPEDEIVATKAGEP
jgi:hypothetical protein